MLESYLSDAARFRMLQTQYHLAQERANSLEQQVAGQGEPVRGQSAADQFVFSMLFEIALYHNNEQPIDLSWDLQDLEGSPLLADLLAQANGRRFLRLYSEEDHLRYEFTDDLPGGKATAPPELLPDPEDFPEL